MSGKQKHTTSTHSSLLTQLPATITLHCLSFLPLVELLACWPSMKQPKPTSATPMTMMSARICANVALSPIAAFVCCAAWAAAVAVAACGGGGIGEVVE